jgi:adenylate cyclase
LGQIFQELKRRHVVRVGIAYLVAGWVAIEFAGAVFPTFEAPEWILKVFTAVVTLGFPLALVLAWAFDITPDGIVNTSAADREAAGQAGAAGITATPEGKASGKRASIAVLPFNNLSDNAEDEYLADGMVEDIITTLSKSTYFLVIARNSTFRYKGTSPDVREVGRELGVNYVVEGSIRRMGAGVRITAQLIEAETGSHVWAEKYDRPIDDLFVVQDEIIGGIARAAGGGLYWAEAARARKADPDMLDAWGLTHRAGSLLIIPTSDALNEAEECLNKAIELAPDLAFAYSSLTNVAGMRVRTFSSADPEADIALAKKSAEMVARLAPESEIAFGSKGMVALAEGRIGDTATLYEKASQLGPSIPAYYLLCGGGKIAIGEIEAGIAMLRRGMQVSPADPLTAYANLYLSLGYLQLEDYDAALKEADLGVQRLSIYPLIHVARALALAGLGKLTEAKDAMARAVELGQGVDVAVLEQRALEYSESPPRKAKIQALFSTINDA